MALTPQERDWLHALLAKEARTDAGQTAMQEILDGMNEKGAAGLPPSWRQDNNTEKEGETE